MRRSFVRFTAIWLEKLRLPATADAPPALNVTGFA
jgi:hypothetical protein